LGKKNNALQKGVSGYLYFIDANIFLEIELEDARKEQCKKFFKRIVDDKEKAIISNFIMYSILLELAKKTTIKKAKDFLIFLEAAEIEIFTPSIEIILKALDKMKEYKLDFDDALVVSCMISNKIKKLVSFDKHFDKIKEIERIEPNKI